MIPDHLLDSKCLNLMPRTVWIFDLENMVDNAGIGKEVILLKTASSLSDAGLFSAV